MIGNRYIFGFASAILAVVAEFSWAGPLPMPVGPRGQSEPLVHQAQFFLPFGQRQIRQQPRRGQRSNFSRGRLSDQPPLRQRAIVPPQPRKSPRVQAPAAPRGPVATVFGEIPAIENSTRVVVFGDSLAAGLANALVTALPEDKGFQVQLKTRSSSGLVRNDFYNWNSELGTAIADQRIDVAVLFVGINDNQAMPVDGVHHQPQTPLWIENYKSRVDDLIKQLRDKGVAVYWVGAPISRLASHSKGMAFINSLTRERAELQGAQFIDIWDTFADENGGYSPDGPDLTGTRRKMRRENGFHFTKAGNEKLAHFVTQAIDRDLSVATLGADGRRVIRQSVGDGLSVAGGAGSNSDVLAGGVTDGALGGASGNDGQGGPLVALSMLGRGGQSDGKQVLSPLSTVFMRGDALKPKRGRADDFAWPRPE